MTKYTESIRKQYAKEWLCIMLLFFYGLTVGMAHFESLRHDGKSAIFVVVEMYGPALMMACGQGFVSPDQSLYPELHKFLEGEEETFSKENLPEHVEVGTSTVAAYHRYLLYLVATVWRIFGISWAHLEGVISLMLGWYAVALYLLLRFFLSRILSFFSTLFFILSPAVMTVLPDIRDFSKAPFTITLLCILLWLAHKHSRLQFQILAATLLGIIHGIALGFRQDTLVLLPLCICVLAFPLFLKHDTSRWKRLAPMLIYLALFFLLASPLLKRMEGAAQPQHALVQGFSKDRLELLGMEEAPYYTTLSGADFYTFAMLYDFAERSPKLSVPDAFDDKDSEAAGQQWLHEAVFLYPADIVARAWAAVCQSFRYADAFPPSFSEPTSAHSYIYDLHRSLAFAMHHAGVLLALVAFIILLRQSPAKALWLFVASCYVLGYTSIQASSRHSFHLSFTSLLVLAFCLETLIKSLWRRKSSTTMAPSGKTRRQTVVFWGGLLACALVIVLPLWVLRWYQTQQLRPVITMAMEAPRTPLPISQKDYCGWTVFSVDNSEDGNASSELASLYKLLAAPWDEELKLWHSRTSYLMAEFDAAADVDHLIHLYDAKTLDNNFSQLLRLPKLNQSGDVLRYFFPVYELLKPELHETLSLTRNRFTGLAIPKALAPHFLGLYEVHLPPEQRHLIAFASMDEQIPAPLFTRLNFIPDPLYYYHTEDRKFRNTILCEGAQRFNRQPEAVLFAQAQVILADLPQLQLPAIYNLISHNHWDEALEGALAANPENRLEAEQLWDCLELIAKLSLYEDHTERCLAALDAMQLLLPEKYAEAALLRIEAFERVGLKKEALEAYQKYLLHRPDDHTKAAAAHVLMSDFFSPEEKISFWKVLVDAISGEAHLYRYLAQALDLLDKEELAKEAFENAYRLDSEDPLNRICKTIMEREGSTAEELKDNITELAQAYPEEHFFIVERLEKEAWYLSGKGEHHKAGTLLLLAAEYSSDSERLRLKAFQQFTGAGNYEKAETGLLELLKGSYGAEAAEALYVTHKLSRSLPDSVALWQQLQQLYPENQTLKTLYNQLREEKDKEALTPEEQEKQPL